MKLPGTYAVTPRRSELTRRTVQNAVIRGEKTKGGLIVAALLRRKSDEEVAQYLIANDQVPSMSTIGNYRNVLRSLGYPVPTDAELRGWLAQTRPAIKEAPGRPS